MQLSGYFDIHYYLLHNPDVKAAGINPILHYLRFGGFEGRNPSLKFESSFYLHRYRDVKTSGMNPLIHYLKFGKRENRMAVDLNGISIQPISRRRYMINWMKNRLTNSKVSIIVPALNAESTIGICLKSLIKQSYDNLEIIVVDDGSEDGTGKLVQKICGMDQRVKYFKIPNNQGTYAAINKGIRIATGKYIAKQDADDISLSTRIEKQMTALKKYKVFFALCFLFRSSLSMEELDGEDHLIMQRLSEKSNPSDHTSTRSQVCLASLIIHKKIFNQYGLYWERNYSSDVELLERVLYHELNISFPGPFNHIVSFFSHLKFHHKLYIVLDEVLYLSSIRNPNNLTIKYPIGGEERKKFLAEWRKRLRNEIEYEYPVL